MNAFGALILGALARGAALAVLGLVLGVLIRRVRPVAGASTTLAALLTLAPLTLCALSPWPHWWSIGEREKPRAATPSVVTSPRANPSSANNPDGFDPRDATKAVRADEPPGGFWDGVGAALRQNLAASEDPGAERCDARTWVAVAFLIGLTLGLIRLGLALRGVRRLRRDAPPIVDAALASELKLLLEDAGASRSIAVEARESRALGTAATVGGRRATLFLPPHWRDWTPDERRVVLAHEVAHIVRGDYAAGVWAQVSLALQFVNPPAHLLASRLRLDQELAADALGAQLAGGRQAYLVNLARLALRLDDQSSRRLGPARAFLPIRGNFMRRIEMLRDENSKLDARPPLWSRAFVVTALAAAFAVLIGIRGPSESLAQDPASDTPKSPAQVGSDRKASSYNLRRIGLALHNYHAKYDHIPPAVVMGGRSNKAPHSWRVELLPELGEDELYKSYNFDEPWDGPNNIKLVERMPAVFRHPAAKKKGASYLAITGPGTMFEGDAGTKFEQVIDGSSNTIMVFETDSEIPWTKPEDFVVDAKNLKAPLPNLVGVEPGGFNTLFVDGSVRFVSDRVSPVVLRAIMSKAGGEVVSADAFDVASSPTRGVDAPRRIEKIQPVEK